MDSQLQLNIDMFSTEYNNKQFTIFGFSQEPYRFIKTFAFINSWHRLLGKRWGAYGGGITWLANTPGEVNHIKYNEKKIVCGKKEN